MGSGRVLMRAAPVLLAVALLVAGVHGLRAPTTDADDVRAADEVVRGNVTGVASRWNDDRTHIVTTATVAVLNRSKGAGPGTVTLAVLGGTADGVTEWVEDEPALVDGSEAYLFVQRNVSVGVPAYGRAWRVVPVVDGSVPGVVPDGEAGIPVEAYDRYLRDLAG